MKTLALTAAAFAIAFLAAAPAHAQATRTWVSGVGDDANPCSRTAPCKTFAGAISKTAASGEINCLDNGGFGGVTITKAITIDCAGTNGSILNAGSTGIIINAGGTTVHIRNLTLNGAGSGLIGISILAAQKVNLENVTISNNTQQGVKNASTTSGSMLVIKNSTISNNGLAGVSNGAASNSGVLLDNVVSKQNQYGLAVGANQFGIVSRSNVSNNFVAGVQTDTNGQAVVDDSMLNNNGTGVQSNGTVTLANTSVVFHATAFGGSGSIISYGNNRVFGNVAVGNSLSSAGAASTDLGQK